MHATRIGLTATVPVEIVFAAGLAPVDLNNLFVRHPRRAELLNLAEEAGLPRNVCTWIRGLYAVAEAARIESVIAVVRGDCTNTEALAELWRHRGVKVVPFSYPYEPKTEAVLAALELLCSYMGVDLDAAEQWRERLAPIRRDLRLLDDLTWKTGQVTGRENFDWLVGSSDFGSDPDRYARGLSGLLADAHARPHRRPRLRLGIVGVPTAIDDMIETVESMGASIVYNETPRQFGMPADATSLAEQYALYTYPYPLPYRLKDVLQETMRRGLNGLIHYVQTFCFHSIEQAILRERSPVPVLLIEADEPGPADERTRTRLQAFIEQLSLAE